MTHQLKIKSEYFKAVISSKKSFEIRRNDRNFQEGDILELREINDSGSYTGAVCYVNVTYVLDSEEYLPKGYVAMSIVLWKIAKMF